MNANVRPNWIVVPFLALALAGILPAAGSVTLTPGALSFGSQVEGTTSASKTATLTNGLSTALTITSIAVSGQYTETATTCPITPSKLAKGASCTISVAFAPTQTGTLSGNLTVKDSATNSPQTVTLTGSGILPVTFAPTSLTFGKLPLGETSAPMTVTVNNNQTTALNITNLVTTGDFAVSASGTTCAGSVTSQCTIAITFTPTATGSRSGNLKMYDSASTSPQTVTLRGTGATAVLQSITVTPSDPTIFTSYTQQFTATGTYSNQTQKTLSGVTWSATPLGIATITAAGLATGQTAGQATITASLGGVTGFTMLTVQAVFTPTGSLNNARYYHTATLLTNGNVLVAGGIGPVAGASGALGELNSAELYNLQTGTFAYTGNLNTARDEHSATLLNDGTVLIAGGSGGDNELGSAEIYNPVTSTFTTTTGSLTTPRYQHTASLLPDGTVLLAGGYSGNTVVGTAEIYSPSTQKFTFTTGTLNNPRFDATATVLPNGTVLIAGGADSNGPLATAEIYDPVLQTFTLTAGSLTTARSSATASLLNTGNVLIADGYNYMTTGPLTSAELYNPSTGTFTVTGTESSTGWLGTATLLGNGDVLVAGSVLNSANAELYDPGSGSFTNTSPLLTPGDLQTATLLTNGAVLVAGGHSNASNTVLAAAELYDPPTLAPANLQSITVAPGSPVLTVGGSQQLVATGNFSNGGMQTLASVTWTSSNASIVTVTNDVTNSGVAYAVGAGSTYVNACVGTICGNAVVTVSAP